MNNLLMANKLKSMPRIFLHILTISLALSFAGCNSTNSETEVDVTPDNIVDNIFDADFEASDWTEATHSKSAEPEFTEVFSDTQIKRFDFVVTEAHWQSMLNNMTDLYGEFGISSVGQRPEQAPQPIATITEDTESIDIDEDPIFVPAEVFYNGTQWYRVGIRFKGNSSLMSSWTQGNLKLSFKMDFDEFEDDYPQIKNQRFYGFKKFSLKNNYDDRSLVREKVASDVFKKAGVAVSNTGFYELYVDHGNGPEYFGLYTLVEEVDGTVLDTQFSSDDGNLYKPENDGAQFVKDSFNQTDFTKKTNEDEEDWSDIQALFEVLHADNRTIDPVTWRENLEDVFDVDVFLKYLAVNGIIQNWDTYGLMPHNFYLYNNPATGLLTWIPWDNNEALQRGKMAGALTLDFSNLDSTEWPLIANIYADETYKAQYDNYLLAVISDAFEPSYMQSLYDDYSALIRDRAIAERDGFTSFFNNPEVEFDAAIAELKAHATSRNDAVDAYFNRE